VRPEARLLKRLEHDIGTVAVVAFFIAAFAQHEVHRKRKHEFKTFTDPHD
jgi:hypothetical protein